MDRKRLLLACGATTIIAFLVIGTCLFAFNLARPIASSGPIKASGTLACLPHKNSSPGQPTTLECAIGLRTEDGRNYALKGLSPTDATTSFTKHVAVSGELSPPTANETYDIIGTITVRTFTAK